MYSAGKELCKDTKCKYPKVFRAHHKAKDLGHQLDDFQKQLYTDTKLIIDNPTLTCLYACVIVCCSL